MKKILSILLCSIFYIVNIFGYTTTTYIQSKDPETKISAHKEFAKPPYLKATNYSELLSKAQEYEKAGKWIYAYGAYSDAALISEGDIEAKEKADSILSAISEGRPGKGKFDTFVFYDKWIELITESEAYFTEYPPFELEIMEPVQGDLHYDTRTADYEVIINIYCTDKIKNLINALNEGFRKSEKNDWNIPRPWFTDSKIVESVVPERIRYEDLKSIANPADKMKNSIELARKKEINITSLISYDRGYCSQTPSFRIRKNLETNTFYEIEIALYDINNKSVTKSERILLEMISGKTDSLLYENTVYYSKWIAKNLNQEIMTKIEAGEVSAKITNIYLHYGYVTLPSSLKEETNYLAYDAELKSIIKKLPETKIDLSKTVIYYAKDLISKLDELTINDLKNKNPSSDKDKLMYGYIKGYQSLYDYAIEHPHFKALANKMSILEGLSPKYYQEQDGNHVYDSSKWIFDRVDTEYSSYGVNHRLFDLQKVWKSVKLDENADGYYIETNSDYRRIILCRNDTGYKARQEELKKEKAKKEAEKRAKLEEEQKKRYLIESGKIPSNISYSDVAVNIDQKNGTIVTQIKQITNGSAFEKSGIQKGDLITDVYVNNTSRYREFIEAVYAKETSSFDILLANTTKEVTFIIQRGKGKKAQTITITIPVEFNFDGYIN